MSGSGMGLGRKGYKATTPPRCVPLGQDQVVGGDPILWKMYLGNVGRTTLHKSEFEQLHPWELDPKSSIPVLYWLELDHISCRRKESSQAVILSSGCWLRVHVELHEGSPEEFEEPSTRHGLVEDQGCRTGHLPQIFWLQLQGRDEEEVGQTFIAKIIRQHRTQAIALPLDVGDTPCIARSGALFPRFALSAKEL